MKVKLSSHSKGVLICFQLEDTCILLWKSLSFKVTIILSFSSGPRTFCIGVAQNCGSWNTSNPHQFMHQSTFGNLHTKGLIFAWQSKQGAATLCFDQNCTPLSLRNPDYKQFHLMSSVCFTFMWPNTKCFPPSLDYAVPTTIQTWGNNFKFVLPNWSKDMFKHSFLSIALKGWNTLLAVENKSLELFKASLPSVTY